MKFKQASMLEKLSSLGYGNPQILQTAGVWNSLSAQPGSSKTSSNRWWPQLQARTY